METGINNSKPLSTKLEEARTEAAKCNREGIEQTFLTRDKHTR